MSLVPYYLSGSILSVLSSLWMLLSYLLFRGCREHPSPLVLWRSIFDLLFCAQIIAFLANSAENRQHCGLYSFLFEFSALGSIVWNCINAFDLFAALRNPFRSPAANIMHYHVIAWTTSLWCGFIITVFNEWSYRSDIELCWSRKDAALNWPNWIAFFLPTMFTYLCSLSVLIYSIFRLTRGLQLTFEIRRQYLWSAIRYVGSFFLWWTCCGGCAALVMLWDVPDDQQAATQEEQLSNTKLLVYRLFALSCTSHGFFQVVIWLYNEDIWGVYKRWYYFTFIKEKELFEFTSDKQDRNINRALRKEVIILTALGIQQAIQHIDQGGNSNETASSDSSSAIVPPLPSPLDYPSQLKPSSKRAPTKIHQILVQSPSPPSAAVRLPLPPSDGVYCFSIQAEVHSTQTPFVDYAPAVFNYLRTQIFGISNESYLTSIRGNPLSSLSEDVLIERFSQGRSGSFFYFTQDQRFLIKTLTQAEANTLLHILMSYVEYWRVHHRSLLPQFFGFHRVQLYNIDIYFVVMKSIFFAKQNQAEEGAAISIEERYDIKGSWIDRNSRYNGHSSMVYKDSDLLYSIELSEQTQGELIQQLEADTAFLAEHSLMDFSLLIGVHRITLQNEENGSVSASSAASSSSFPPSSSPSPLCVLHSPRVSGPGIYLLGLIDVLQPYDLSKILERLYKTILQRKDPDGISALPPERYQKRFMQAIKRIINFKKQETEDVLALQEDEQSIPPESYSFSSGSSSSSSTSIPLSASRKNTRNHFDSSSFTVSPLSPSTHVQFSELKRPLLNIQN